MHSWAASLRDIALCASLALVLWVPLGRWAVSRIGGEKAPGGFALAGAVGLGLWGLGVLGLGLAALLYRSVLFISAAAAFLGLRLYRFVPYPAAPRPPDLPPRVYAGIPIAVLSFCYLAIALGASLAPETAFDSLNVHLPYARDAAAAHAAGFQPNNWSSVMPALPLMSYITAFLISGVTLAKLFNFLCYLLCGGVIWSFSSSRLGPIPAFAAALLFWSCPVAIYESTTAMIDLPLTLFSSAAALALLEWVRSDDAACLRISAVSLGLAFGCKYHAAFWVAPFLLVIVWHTLRARRQGWRRTLSQALGYLGIVALLAAPWMIRAWYYTGNPVFPAANRLFKSPYFPPAMEAAAMAAYANEGVGISPGALIRLPWTLSLHPGPFRGTLGWVFLAGVAAALLRRKPPVMRYGLLISGIYFYTWALTAQDIRYLLPLVPLLAVITAAGLFGSDAPDANRKPAMEATVALAIVLVGSSVALPPVYPRIVKEWTYWHAYQSPQDYLLGRESKLDYLKRDVPSIYAYDYVNANLAGTDRVLLLNDASQFYSRVPTLYSFTVEADRLLFEESEEGVMRRLRESRITHVLLNYNGIAPVPGVAPRRGVYFFLDQEFQARHMAEVFSRNKVVLYKIH